MIDWKNYLDNLGAIANIAEYAAKTGMSFEKAKKRARFHYEYMIYEIHGGKPI